MAAFDSDIVQDSAKLLRNSEVVTQAILEQRAELDRKGKHNQPLIVVSGESALIPAHALDLILILDTLKKKETVALCYEHGHDALQKEFSRVSGEAPDAKQEEFLKKQDRTGAVTLKYTFGWLANRAHQALFSFLLDQNIPTRFTDVSSCMRDSGSCALNDNDPSTAACMRQCFNERSGIDIDPEMTEGFQVRNLHMASHSLEVAARIVIQHGGNFHVIGSNPYFPARHSVTANLKAMGASLLAMPRLMQGFQEQDIPADHGLSEKERLFVKGLPETGINMGFGPEGWAERAAYTESLMAHSGLDSIRLTSDRHTRLKEQYARDVARIFSACMP